MSTKKKKRILIVGVGGLGTVIARELALSRECAVGLIDGDRVTRKDAYRQILYTKKDVGVKKVIAVRARLREMQPSAQINIIDDFLTEENALSLISAYDIIVDAADNYRAEFLMNDACVFAGKPFLYGAIHGLRGQVAFFNVLRHAARQSTNLRCVFPSPASYLRFTPKTTGSIALVVGSIMAFEILKYIRGEKLCFVDRMCEIDLEVPRIRTIRLAPNSDNPLTGIHPIITSLRQEP